jgi:hypothetical protein
VTGGARQSAADAYLRPFLDRPNLSVVTDAMVRMPHHTWLITGSSRGFGRALAAAALEAGDHVAATARRPQQGRRGRRVGRGQPLG